MGAPWSTGLTRCLRGATLQGLPHLLRHRHTHAHTQTSAHAAVGGAGGSLHRFGGLELGVTAKVADNAHLGALVHCLFDSWRQRDVFDVQFRDRDAVFGNSGRDFSRYQFAQISGVRRHVQNRDARPCQHPADLLHDDVADLERDLVHGEFTIGAHDLGQEPGRIHHANAIGAKGPQAHRAELRVAGHDRVLGAPFQIIEAGRVDKVDL